ncbi:hypothetical protein VTN31DRAFT_6478 [Thermomyces dupontii]|uniref:uncharacterized protein n=1 Tax=Talaromyces thermophilus TaxID=28565 RepID=UPI0037448804
MYPCRQVPTLTLEELPVTDDDGDTLLGSDEELDEAARATKRRRIELLGESYLRGNQLYIASASLKGPFENGWRNPWKKLRKPVPGSEASHIQLESREKSGNGNTGGQTNLQCQQVRPSRQDERSASPVAQAWFRKDPNSEESLQSQAGGSDHLRNDSTNRPRPTALTKTKHRKHLPATDKLHLADFRNARRSKPLTSRPIPVSKLAADEHPAKQPSTSKGQISQGTTTNKPLPPSFRNSSVPPTEFGSSPSPSVVSSRPSEVNVPTSSHLFRSNDRRSEAGNRPASIESQDNGQDHYDDSSHTVASTAGRTNADSQAHPKSTFDLSRSTSTAYHPSAQIVAGIEVSDRFTSLHSTAVPIHEGDSNALYDGPPRASHDDSVSKNVSDSVSNHDGKSKSTLFGRPASPAAAGLAQTSHRVRESQPAIGWTPVNAAAPAQARLGESQSAQSSGERVKQKKARVSFADSLISVAQDTYVSERRVTDNRSTGTGSLKPALLSRSRSESFAERPLTLSGPTPSTEAPDGQGHIVGLDNMDLDQVVHDTQSWLRQSWDLDKELKNCSGKSQSHTQAEVSSIT